MAYDLDVILELQDEGLISREIEAEHFLRNSSLIGQDILKLYNDAVLSRCSINQSQLAGWSWLIGSNGGALQPLLCTARKRDTCEVEYLGGMGVTTGFELIVILGCLFALANLVSLAVWCRCKSPAIQHEVSIQLLLMRVLSVLGIVGSLGCVLYSWWPSRGRTRVFSLLHAVLTVPYVNLTYTLSLLCYKLSAAIGFLASIYLVEHSHAAQCVLLYVSLRRAKVLLAASSLICLALYIPSLLTRGSIYCVNAGAAYVLHEMYSRVPINFLVTYHIALFTVSSFLILLTMILLIVYASKRCCSCCRGNPSPAVPSESVAYARQLSTADDEASSEPPVVIKLGTPMPQGYELADELRRLIFWLQVMACIVGIIWYILRNALIPFDKHRLVEIVMLSRLIILPPILSPTYRRGFLALVVELKDSIVRFVGCRRR